MKRALLSLCIASTCACGGPRPDARVTGAAVLTETGAEARRVVIELDEQRVAAVWEGEVTLDVRDRRVQALGPGASLALQQETGMPRRRFLYRGEGEEGLVVVHHLGTRRVVPDEAALAWEARVLQALVAGHDLGGPARRARLLEEGGARSLLDHLEFVSRGAFAQAYLAAAAEDAGLDAEELGETVLRAARLTDGGAALAPYLVAVAARWPEDPDLTETLVRAARSVRPGPARSEVLGTLVVERRLSVEASAEILAALEGLSNASERTFVLVAFLVGERVVEADHVAWLDAVDAWTPSPRREELLRGLGQQVAALEEGAERARLEAEIARRLERAD